MAKWTDKDYDKLYANLGRYLIIFQWMEGKLDQILLLGWGHENWTRSHRKLSKMTNDAKITAVENMVLTSSDFARVHTRPEWVAHFNDVILALQKERDRRNDIIHSQTLFEFADAGIGVPIISTRKRGTDKDVDFRYLELSEEHQQKMIGEIAALSMKINFVHVQLVHDYCPPNDPRMQMRAEDA